MKWRNPSPVLQEIHLVRPLLDLPKTALRQYAADFKIKFREDESNACPDIPRNRIRHHLLPLLKQLQPALETTLLRTMAVIGAETDFVGQTARDWLAQRTPDSFKELHVAIQRRCVQLQLLDLGLVPNFELVEQLRLAGAKPVSVSLAQPEPTQTKHESPLGVVCDANGIVSLRPPKPDTFTTTTLALNLGKTAGNALFGGLRVKWAILRQKASKPLRAIPGQEYFDADKVGSKIRLRHWQPGDRFQPSGMSKGVKLQDLFVNHKIPQQQRHSLVVAQTAANEVFWVEGLRISERFKLAKTTNRRLHWQWRRV